jgi:hypothetical protein
MRITNHVESTWCLPGGVTVMKRRFWTTLSHLAVLATGAAAGALLPGLVSDLVHGRKEPAVADADINIGALPGCNRDLGGIRRGTPVSVRRHGPFNVVAVEFLLPSHHPPLRNLSAAEAARARRELFCQGGGPISLLPESER